MEFHTIPLFFYSLTTSKALDTITKTRFITVDSNTTIVSPSESFEMRFFKPGNSNNRYLGIWYKKISTGTVSFDYPCDTLLPGMKLGKNLVTGREWNMSSWKSEDDPGRGDYSYWLDPRGYPQIFISNGSVELFRTGPWNGLQFSGTSLRENPIYSIRMYFERDKLWIWIDRNRDWVLYLNSPSDNCDSYRMCGSYGSCDVNKPLFCGCLSKFVPKNSISWAMIDWSEGCVRRTPLDCKNGDGFVKYSGMKLPDTWSSWFNRTMTIGECREVCLKNCSCMAYTSLDISRGGSGCLLWFDDLVDLRVISESGQDIYIRMASSESGTMRDIFKQGGNNERQKKDLELPLFDLATIMNATNNFSTSNKLGQGGFGTVYKGVLEDGQEIAVKTLSKNSKQGVDEFKNEVIYIARLQHRNLVKLLGYCFRGEEKMLIYEYMPNKSLDLFIFDITQRVLLDRPKRLNIINGIARGLLYLHQDSRLRIIHRDLKASNILLDNEMNPKISDFGMARHFGGNESEANTSRVVGTYGYMSPEYTIDGIFSVKSDVYSFGVLVLEIVSGKRNRGFSHPEHHLNLLGHVSFEQSISICVENLKLLLKTVSISQAWKLCIEGRPRELVDPSVEDLENLSELVRAIHVGLLCVQQYPEDRPNMSTVVLMLGGEGGLPQPKQPGFFTERNVLPEKGSSTSTREPGSDNIVSVTVTLLEGR
ncbi:hypothetical protein ACSBR2_028200 [Camellia fascicularis]